MIDQLRNSTRRRFLIWYPPTYKAWAAGTLATGSDDHRHGDEQKLPKSRYDPGKVHKFAAWIIRMTPRCRR